MIPDAVDLARRLIGFNTLNPPGEERECLEYLGALFRDGGFSVRMDEFAPGRFSLSARLHPGAGNRKPLCFGGHIDTVPLGANTWSVDPFAGTVRDGNLFGRGASDMKGGVAAMTVAALAAAPKLTADQELMVHVYGGEETGCEGSLHMAGNPDLFGTPGAVVISEPTGNRPLAGHRGALWLELTARGRTAHASMPEMGDNALERLLSLAGRIGGYAFPVPDHPFLGRPTLACTTLHAGLNINSIPDRAVLTLDIRTVPGLDGAAVAAELSALLGDGIGVRTLLDLPPVWTEPDTPWISRIKTRLARRMDSAPGVEIVEFFTDATAFRKAGLDVPILILGPGDPHHAHQTDEHCAVAQLRTATAMYLDIIADWYKTAAG